METGGREGLLKHEADFPCDLTDARFDAVRSIQAGAIYTGKLRKSFGGNIYLMYIGYNSGPGIARRIWRKTGKNPAVTLKAVQAVLVNALRHNFGDAAKSRARALGDRTLPRVKRAYDRYLAEARAAKLQGWLEGDDYGLRQMASMAPIESTLAICKSPGTFLPVGPVANGVHRRLGSWPGLRGREDDDS
jgi:hypothetical protein